MRVKSSWKLYYFSDYSVMKKFLWFLSKKLTLVKVSIVKLFNNSFF